MSDATITFSDLNLAAPIQKTLQEEQYTTPTPIQAQAIPHLLEGKDLLGCAQTGTGKTAAFALPILHKLATNRPFATKYRPHVLVLSPTRELAAQIGESFATYGRNLKLRQTVIYGGVNQYSQVRDLERGVHICIATPGRLLDLMDQGYIFLDEMQTFVLDEADRMLDMGFMPDLKKIIAQLPEDRQSLFFSATMSPNISDLANTLLNDPVRVEISPVSSTNNLIDQRVLFVDYENKTGLLEELLSEIEVERMLVFTRTKRGADKVAQVINRAGHRADSIHGDKTQGARSRALAGFKRGHTKVLVATDIAARGIDVDGITHVINYDLPDEAENYVHRIGRTGRAGKQGMALSFCDATERGTLRAIERITKAKIYVEMDHPFHSEAASQSRDEARKPGSYRGKRTGGFQRGGGGGRSPYPPRNDRNDRRDRNDRNDRAPRFNESSENSHAPQRERFPGDAPKPRSRNFGDNQAPRPPRRGDRPRSSNYKEPT